MRNLSSGEITRQQSFPPMKYKTEKERTNMQLTQEILRYIDEHREEAYQLLIELAQIPAPSNHEEKCAAFCYSIY